jgi:hypothetical protein
MKVKLLVSRAGADGAFAPGDEIEVGTAEAGRMIEAGQAVPVRGETLSAKPQIERAVKASGKETR